MAESISSQRQELWQAVDLFARRQQEQEQDFLNGGDRDLDVWLGQQQQLFAALQYHLNQVTPGVTLAAAEESRLREKIGELLAGERRLALAASRRQAEVSEELGRLRKGRIGLNGYRFCDSLATGPRFVSRRR